MTLATIRLQAQLSLSNTHEGKMILTFFNKGTEEEKETGREFALMQICYVLQEFNRSIKVSEDRRMDYTEIYGLAIQMLEDLKWMRLEDLLLCLRFAKEGKFGPIFNRVDSSTIMSFWGQYKELYWRNFEADKLSEKSQYGQFNTEAQTIAISRQRANDREAQERLAREAYQKRVEKANFNNVTNENQ